MTAFKWNWQYKNWPEFTYDESALKDLVAKGILTKNREFKKYTLLFEF